MKVLFCVACQGIKIVRSIGQYKNICSNVISNSIYVLYIEAGLSYFCENMKWLVTMEKVNSCFLSILVLQK